jgi:hypothetical protein
LLPEQQLVVTWSNHLEFQEGIGEDLRCGRLRWSYPSRPTTPRGTWVRAVFPNASRLPI